MNRRTKRSLVVGGAALAIVGGGGAALAAGGDLFGTNDRQAFLDDAAARLKVDSNDLKSALSDAFDDRVDAAVKDGKLTKEQGEALKARVKQNGGLPFFGGGPGFRNGPGMGRGGPHGGPRASLTAAAKYLGLTDGELRTQLESGKTLAQVAKARNKSVDGLKAAMVAAAKADLAADVKAGRLTQAQADAMLADLSARLGDMIQNGTKGFGHRDGPRGGGRATMTAAAKYLGLSEAQLRTQLESGKTLAEIATAQGKSVAGLNDALVAAGKAELAADVKAGRLTQAQADAMLADLPDRLDDTIQNGRRGFGHRGGPDGGHRFQFRGGSGFPGGGAPATPPPLPPAA